MTSSGGSSGGGSRSGSSGSDSTYSKKKDTAGTGRAKDLSDAVPVSLSDNGSSGSASRADASSGGDGLAIQTGRPQSVYTPTPQAQFGSAKGAGDQKPIGTTVTQKPAAGAVDGPENTTVTSTPRSDFSVVLAGQVGRRADRSPSRSNNFVSLVGGAGGLGRRSAESKRTLIGGA